MKTRRVVTAIATILAVLVLLTGCSSVSALIKANMSGLPYWYYMPDSGAGKGNTGIVAEGSASTERQAELLAYTDLLNKLSARTGTEFGQEAYRELSVMGTLSQFGLYMNDSFSEVASDGSYHYYIHAIADASILEAATTDEYRKKASVSGEIESLVLEGDAYVKSGHEFKAVKNYMKAMAMGLGMEDVPDEYSYDALYPVVYELLQAMNISIISARPEEAVCVVGVSRKGMFASSVVEGAGIMATYTAVDIRGTVYSDSFTYISGEDGTFTFNSINNSILRSGSILFSLNLSEEIADLEKLAPGERTTQLKQLIESKSVRFDYAKTYQSGNIAVSVIEHDELGYVTGVRDMTDYLTGKFKADGADALAFYATLDDEEDISYEFNHSGNKAEYLLVIRIGVVDIVDSRTGIVAANAEGLATLFRCSDEKVEYQSEVLNASSFASTEEEAVEGAFMNLADIAYTLVKAQYV